MVGLGPTQTSSRSAVAQGRVTACCRRTDSTSAVHPLRGVTKRQLPQGDEVRLLKKALHRPFGLLGDVDLSRLQADQQVLGGNVHQLQVIGRVEDLVGDRLPDRDARHLADHVVQALDVLDIERGPDVDSRFEQFLHVLPAFRMPRAFGIRVGQFIDQQQFRPPAQGGIDIELPQRHPAVLDLPNRKDLQPLQQRFRFRTAVRLDVADHHLPALGLGPPCRFQHRVGLADSRRIAEEHFERPAACLSLVGLDSGQQFIGIGSSRGHGSTHPGRCSSEGHAPEALRARPVASVRCAAEQGRGLHLPSSSVPRQHGAPALRPPPG